LFPTERPYFGADSRGAAFSGSSSRRAPPKELEPEERLRADRVRREKKTRDPFPESRD